MVNIASKIMVLVEKARGRRPEPRVGVMRPPREEDFIRFLKEKLEPYPYVKLVEFNENDEYAALRDTFSGAYTDKFADVTTPFGDTVEKASASENEKHYYLLDNCISAILKHYTDRIPVYILNDIIRLQDIWRAEIGSRSLYEVEKLIDHIIKYVVRVPVDRLTINEIVKLHMMENGKLVKFPEWEVNTFLERSDLPSGSNTGFPLWIYQTKEVRELLVSNIWPEIRIDFFRLVKQVEDMTNEYGYDVTNFYKLTYMLDKTDFLEKVEKLFKDWVAYWTAFTRTQRVPDDNKTRVVQGAGTGHKLVKMPIWKRIIPILIKSAHFLYGDPIKFMNELNKIIRSKGRNVNIDFSGHEQAITFKRQLAHQMWWGTGLNGTRKLNIKYREKLKGRATRKEIEVHQTMYYFSVCLFGYFDAQAPLIVTPNLLLVGLKSGLKSGDLTTSGVGSCETRMYAKAMQNGKMIATVLKLLNLKLKIPKKLKFEYCDMGDDLLSSFTDEQYSFWKTEIKTVPEFYKLPPGKEVDGSLSLVDVYLNYWFGAIISFNKSQDMVDGHAMVLKKQAFHVDGVLHIMGLAAAVINSLTRLERDSSIFNSELFREMFKVDENLTAEEANTLRNIAVLYNVRDGPYLRYLVAALYVGDATFTKWVDQNNEERATLFRKVTLNPVEWRIASQSDWEVFLKRLETTIKDVKFDADNSITSELRDLQLALNPVK
jgi:hypothetical protein